LKRSSNAFRELSTLGVVVSRSTVVRGPKCVQELRTFFGDTRAGTGSMHSKRLPGSKDTHCAHVRRSTAHRGHLVSVEISAPITYPHCAQRTTSR
jgi:hypothetical protein